MNTDRFHILSYIDSAAVLKYRQIQRIRYDLGWDEYVLVQHVSTFYLQINTPRRIVEWLAEWVPVFVPIRIRASVDFGKHKKEVKHTFKHLTRIWGV